MLSFRDLVESMESEKQCKSLVTNTRNETAYKYIASTKAENPKASDCASSLLLDNYKFIRTEHHQMTYLGMLDAEVLEISQITKIETSHLAISDLPSETETSDAVREVNAPHFPTENQSSSIKKNLMGSDNVFEGCSTSVTFTFGEEHSNMFEADVRSHAMEKERQASLVSNTGMNCRNNKVRIKAHIPAEGKDIRENSETFNCHDVAISSQPNVFTKKVKSHQHFQTQKYSRIYSTESASIKTDATAAAHETNELLKCDICSLSFPHKSQLECHQQVHALSRPFECSNCLRRFNQLAHLNIHMRTHSGEKPFQCDSCGAKFSRKDRLRSHIRIHTGEKPYACPKCSNTFKNPWNLKKHLKDIHEDNHLFECRICHVSFANLTTFTSHWKTHN